MKSNQLIKSLGGLQIFGRLIGTMLDQLNKVERKDDEAKTPVNSTEIEFYLRLTLNVFMNMLIYNNDDPSLATELLNNRFIQVEEVCVKAVKISIELAIVPIRKLLIIFFIYLRLLFTDRTRDPVGLENDQIVQDIQAKMPYGKPTSMKDNPYLKENSERYLSADAKLRFHLKTDHPVEQFYKRYMTNDQPIPQIIVVGILRVLLTTCPNNAKNAGGIDLHSEWSSCLNLLLLHRDFFVKHGFKSKVFEKTNSLLTADPQVKKDEEKKSE